MKKLLLLLLLSSNVFAGTHIDPVSFPWLNAPAGVNQYHMADYPNRVTVFLPFKWYCQPNHLNVPNVLEMVKEYWVEDLVRFVYLSVDYTIQDAQKWQDKYTPPIPVVYDVDHAAFDILAGDYPYFPQALVVDCKGDRVHDKIIGVWDADKKDQIHQAIQDALSVECN